MKYLKYLFIPFSILFVWLFIKSCDGPDEVIDTPLPEDQVLRVAAQDNTITVQTSSGAETLFVPDHGSALINVEKNGDVTLTVKDKGFTLVPVIGFFGADKLSIAGGAQFGYWSRFELYGAVIGPRVAGLLGGGYRLDQLHLNNTSIYVGYTTRKDVGVGVFVRF